MPTGADATLFCVNVAPVVTNEREALFKQLLVLNFTDEVTEGATLGLVPDGEEIVLRYTRDAEDLNYADVECILCNLIELAKKLEQMLLKWQRDHRAPSSEPVADQDADDAPSRFQFKDYA